MKVLIDKLNADRKLSRKDWIKLISSYSLKDAQYAALLASDISQEVFDRNVFFRGIIEFTNICKNDCYYCGLRRSAKSVARYRLPGEEIFECCKEGYELGFRTFVLQGAEDDYYTDERVCAIVTSIKEAFSDVAVTLSLGERSKESYERLFKAGAERYLLRHETASKDHYRKLHPPGMSYERRILCLNQLREIGYQTGCGMMVGSPFQSIEDLADDMLFMEEFKPHMIGIGPFRSNHDTPFRESPDGSSELTLFLMSLCRIMNPYVLLPATTALDCNEDKGRQKAILAGANVIMPNLSPKEVRKDYLLYDRKPGLDQDAALNLMVLKKQMDEIGYKMVVDRGDYKEENYGIE
jgi:biotin synthase